MIGCLVGFGHGLTTRATQLSAICERLLVHDPSPGWRTLVLGSVREASLDGLREDDAATQQRKQWLPCAGASPYRDDVESFGVQADSAMSLSLSAVLDAPVSREQAKDASISISRYARGNIRQQASRWS